MSTRIEFPSAPVYPRRADGCIAGRSRRLSARHKNHDHGPSLAGLGKEHAVTRLYGLARLRGVILMLGLLATVTGLMTLLASAQPQQNLLAQIPLQQQQNGHQQLPPLLDEARVPRPDTPPTLNDKQEKRILHANFEKSKRDAAELATLAKQLREELSKPNVDVLSLEVVNRADKIERLAKKIREETKGY